MTLDFRTPVSLREAYLEATPSEPLVFHVTVHNTSPGPRTYTANAIGLKNARVEATPSLLRLPANAEGEIVLSVRPVSPTSSFPAGRFLVGIRVHDTTPSSPSVTLLDAAVVVLSVADVVATLARPHLKAWMRDRTTLVLRNDGDHALALRVSGSDPEQHLTFTFSRSGVRLGPDDAIEVPEHSSRALTVQVAAGARLVGAPAGRAYEVVARGPGGAVATTGTFTHRALFPPLLFKILLAAVVVVAGMFVARAVVQRFIVDPPVFTWEDIPDTDAAGGPLLEGRVGHTAVWLQYPRPPEQGFAERQWRTFVNWFLGRDQEVEGMIVWGGRSAGGGLLGDGAFLRAEDRVWIGLADENNVAGAPAPRSDHAAIWTGETMAVWGGRVDGTAAPLDRGAEYDPRTRRWSELPAGGPQPRVGHTLTWTGDAAFVIGGVDPDGTVHRDVWKLTPGQLDPVLHPDADPGEREMALDGGTWTRLSDLPGPTGARHHHTTTWTGTHLVVFGGFGVDGAPLADAYALDPAASDPQWIDITANPPPTARACHAGLWTGSEILILGGTAERRPAATQAEAAAVCRNTAAVETGAAVDGLGADVLVDDPEALLLSPPQTGDDPTLPASFGWSLPAAAPPRHLGSDFRALWTANEATVLQAVPQLDTIAAVRYSPADGSASLPLPNESIIGPVRGFTTVWINGGIIAWGGVEAVDAPGPDGDGIVFSNEGALLVLPDR